jgi:integron integrase
MNQQTPKLLDQVRSTMTLKRYSYRTQSAYIRWIAGYIRFHKLIHPKKMREPEIEKYLSHLAENCRISASTQAQALAAILFLYKEILEIELTERINAIRPSRGRRLPVVLSSEEVNRLLLCLDGTPLLIVEVLYGTGIRLNEFLNLRIKDIDLTTNRIMVVGGKGNKDRITILPNSIKTKLTQHIQRVKELHNQDLEKGLGSAFLPNALDRKYKNIGKQFGWQFLFPSSETFNDANTGNSGRWHINESTVSKILRKAARKAEIYKHVTAHTLRHSFATHLLDCGVNLRIIQELLGHRSTETTMIYTHLIKDKLAKTQSPLDHLNQERLRQPLQPQTLQVGAV